jgi:hypothetical protein
MRVPAALCVGGCYNRCGEGGFLTIPPKSGIMAMHPACAVTPTPPEGKRTGHKIQVILLKIDPGDFTEN